MTTRSYLLDTNVVSYFLNTKRHDALREVAGRVNLAILDEVRVELEAHKTLGPFVKKWLPKTKLAVRAIVVGSVEYERYVALKPNAVTLKDNGERASIAVAAANPSFVFVASDKNALWLALRELHEPGERILGLPVWLRRMRSEAALDAAALDDVAAASGVPYPTWWTDWRQEIARGSQASPPKARG